MTFARPILAIALLAVASAASAAGPATRSGTAADAVAPRRTLAAYRSEAEFGAAMARWRDAAARLQAAQRSRDAPAGSSTPMAMAPAPAVAQSLAKAEAKAGADESITNVQTAGVDEGGIVKRAGDWLVVLRRGRLFTVRIGGDALAAAAATPAYGPDVNPSGAWYDEMLVAGNTIAVIGYSYERGGTEVGLFDLGANGSLAYRATYHLRSFDYYSSRNYASRLVGNKLVFYSPTYLHAGMQEPAAMLPAMRRWHQGALPSEFQRILPATRIYRSDDDFDPRETLALHTVTSCDLGSAPLQCESSAVIGPAGRVFYVSQGSVYVWTSSWNACAGATPAPGCTGSAVFRLPLDGSAPSALKTAGVPIDQMSFLEDDGGYLDVLLRESGRGEAMWGSERTRGRMALLRVPLSAFGDGRDAAQREHYRELPSAPGHDVQNRFVGAWLLWGGGTGATMPGEPNAWAVRFQGRNPVVALAPRHAVERIEAMGADALLVGNAGNDLRFTSVRLQDAGAGLSGTFVQAGARQGESRSHGFFYKPVAAREGIVALPMVGAASGLDVTGGFGRAHGSASVLYLRQRDLAFTALGRLDARPGRSSGDGCVASCVDWYGNARPIFIGERVFALLGYELVEGRIRGDRAGESTLVERRRIGFAPADPRSERYTPFQ